MIGLVNMSVEPPWWALSWSEQAANVSYDAGNVELRYLGGS